VGALDDLRSAASRLDVARQELDSALSALGFRNEERQAVGALGADVVSCALYLLPHATIEAHAAATRESAITMPSMDKVRAVYEREREDVLGMLAELAAAEPSEIETYFRSSQAAYDAGRGSKARLLLSFKSAYFLIRALQDGLYRVGLGLTEGGLSENVRRASMSTAANSATKDREHSLSSILGEFGNEYFTWFRTWRALRDSIKFGRPDALLGPIPGMQSDDYGISLVLVDEHGGIEVDLSRGTRISDVARALEMTTGLVERLTEAARIKARP
jgi:hypothetical protein